MSLFRLLSTKLFGRRRECCVNDYMRHTDIDNRIIAIAIPNPVTCKKEHAICMRDLPGLLQGIHATHTDGVSVHSPELSFLRLQWITTSHECRKKPSSFWPQHNIIPISDMITLAQRISEQLDSSSTLRVVLVAERDELAVMLLLIASMNGFASTRDAQQRDVLTIFTQISDWVDSSFGSMYSNGSHAKFVSLWRALYMHLNPTRLTGQHIRENLSVLQAQPVVLASIRMHGIPEPMRESLRPFITLIRDEEIVYSSLNAPSSRRKLDLKSGRFTLTPSIKLQGDMICRIYHMPADGTGGIKIVDITFHTLFAAATVAKEGTGSILFTATEVHRAVHSPFRLPATWTLEFLFEAPPTTTPPQTSPVKITESPDQYHTPPSSLKSTVSKVAASSQAATASALDVEDITFGISTVVGATQELDTSNDEEFARRLQAEFEAEEAGARLTSIPPTTTPPRTLATSPQPLAASSSQDIETPSHLESDMEFARRLQEELDREEARATAAALSQRLRDDSHGPTSTQRDQLRQLMAALREAEQHNTSPGSSAQDRHSSWRERSSRDQSSRRELPPHRHSPALARVTPPPAPSAQIRQQAQQPSQSESATGARPSLDDFLRLLLNMQSQQSLEPRAHEQTHVISSLPTSLVPSTGVILTQECQVCYEMFVAGEHFKTLPCLHKYHVDCIDNWLQRKPTCPVCLHPLSSLQ